ncbi:MULTISPECIES: globin domain-containing protein [Kribbella]|uniref:nitric oxide dioxygenase n=1 Tax=Kribbella karoonensis TaxID=324851 RepID=A0ABN2CRN1_9ACTN
MLTPKSRTTVAATLPAVGAAVGEITTNFYGRLFAAHPALLTDLFNRGNQANGDQPQALAGSIARFATALLADPVVPPTRMLARIAHKHASLGVAPELYPVVYDHLFGAIAEVLGEAVTPEVAEAWTEVYWLMANALIALETDLYAAAAIKKQDVWRQLPVLERRDATADTVVFTVGPPVPSYLPGQYVSVQVPLPDGAQQIRQYSLLDGPGSATYSFAVRRTGGEVSAYLHEEVAVGDTLRVSAPFGTVTLPEGDAPLVLASAGIGITPMLSLLRHLAATDAARPVTVLHGEQTAGAHAFRAELEALSNDLPGLDIQVWYEEAPADWPAERTGFVELDGLPIAAGTTAFLCGPFEFMQSVRTQLLEAGVAAADVHYEVFGPDTWLVN